MSININKLRIKKNLLRALILTIIFLLIIIVVGDLFYKSISVADFFQSPFYKDLKYKEGVKTVCIFVPHPDDEIWLAGPIIPSLVEEGIDVHCIFYTDGISSMQGERNLEALRSCISLGLDENNVHFLGFENLNQFEEKYPDGTRTPELRDSIKIAIADKILKIKPQLIISSDFDFNRDHRLYSILFDETIGELLNEHKLDINTIIWKGFCYNTAYYSVDDYYDSINLLSTVKPIDVQNQEYETDIPQFLWKNRLRLPVSSKALEKSSAENYLMDAAKRHVTQHVRKKFFLSTNSDVVFWNRNVNNLVYESELSASSGEVRYLRDFKFYDTDSLTYSHRYNVKFSDFLWMPDSLDYEKRISMRFKRSYKIKELVFYDNPSLTNNIKCLVVRINGEDIPFHDIDKAGGPSILNLEKFDSIKNIDLYVKDFEGNDTGISELEIIPVATETISINKICDSNGNFIYTSFIDSNTNVYKLSYYSSSNDECSIILKEGTRVSLKNNILTFKSGFKDCTVALINNKTGKLEDEVRIVRLSKSQEIYWEIYKNFDRSRVGVYDKIERNIFVQKILRVMHYPEGIWN